jgi:uncharacterized heparinase superfamily protein
LWQQAAYLYDHLEWDLRANHLFRNAVGLVWAGRFFAEPQARLWLEAGGAIAGHQADEQILADGGHFERSPLYHIQVMEDLLSLTLLLEDAALKVRLLEAWIRMADFLTWNRHPDGQIALFNDAALHASCEPEQMLAMASHLGIQTEAPNRPRGGRLFSNTGMVVWHGQPWTVFFDVGPIGPDYQPGHAHADTLSFECSYRDRRLFVDPGTYGYDDDDRRRYDRSTAAHNTVAIDHQDSSEVWHIFRVGRRAYPLDVSAAFSGDTLCASASHNGYDHIRGRPRHWRRITVSPNGSLAVTDRIDGSGRHFAQGGFLLAPEWESVPAVAGWILKNGSDSLRLNVRGPETLSLFAETAPYHPQFGRELETTRLGWRTNDRLPVEVIMLVEGI